MACLPQVVAWWQAYLATCPATFDPELLLARAPEPPHEPFVLLVNTGFASSEEPAVAQALREVSRSHSVCEACRHGVCTTSCWWSLQGFAWACVVPRLGHDCTLGLPEDDFLPHGHSHLSAPPQPRPHQSCQTPRTAQNHSTAVLVQQPQ